MQKYVTMKTYWGAHEVASLIRKRTHRRLVSNVMRCERKYEYMDTSKPTQIMWNIIHFLWTVDNIFLQFLGHFEMLQVCYGFFKFNSDYHSFESKATCKDVIRCTDIRLMQQTRWQKLSFTEQIIVKYN